MDYVQISKIETTNIGRSRQNDICILQDEMVSRKHGKIIPKARRYMLQDLGSINGTFINTVWFPCPLRARVVPLALHLCSLASE